MNVRLVGISYRLPRLCGVTYRIPRITDVELWENHRILRLKDIAFAMDSIRFLTDIGVKDSAVAWSRCLQATPPFIEYVGVVEHLTVAIQYSRTERDSAVPNSSMVFGMDKHLKDVAVIGDKVSISFTKVQNDFVAVYDGLDLFATSFVNISDTSDAADPLRFKVDKKYTDYVSAVDYIQKDTERDEFSDSSLPSDSMAWSFTKKLIDSVTVTDFLEVLWSRSASSMYGQSTYGGATFGG